MTPFFCDRVHPMARRTSRSLRPMLECLEDRNLLSADVTFNFSVPSGVGNAGQTINFYIYGTLEPATQGGTGYTPSSGPDASTFIPAGTVVYLEDTSGVFDWAIPTASSNVPAFQTVNANTADTFSVTLPGTYVISGNIVMGVGSSAQPFNLVANSGSPVTISTPVPGTFPNNVYDFAEFSYDSGGLDTDLTEVDQAGMPYTVTTANSGISYQRGITQDLTTLQSLFTQYMTSTSNAADFRNLYQPGDLRILSPKDYLGSAPGTDPLNSYFNSQLLSFFNYYQTHTFSLDYSGDGTFTGGTTTISSGGNTYTVLQLSNSAYPGQYFNIYEPFFSTNTSGVIPNPPPPPSWLVNTTETPGQMVFGQDGVFNSGGADTSAPNAGYLSDVENAISSAFNRGIAASMAPDDWANAPLNLTASVGNSGSPTNDNLVSGTPYYYVITAVNGAGETVASNEVTATPTGATPSVTLNWTAANGPSQGDNTMLGVRSYNIYRGTSLGQEVLIGNASNTDGPPNNNPLVSFTDTGLTAQSPTVTPPAYYATGSTSNYYAAFLHQNSTLNPTSGITVNGLAYGFPYDDQGGNSTNVQLTTPATATITLVAWSNSTSASPTPTPTPTPIHDSLPAGVELLFLAEDQFALTLDSMMAMFGTNPLWTQAADHLMMALNNLLHLDNPALGTGLVGLQSAIQSNPLHGTLWAYGAQGFGLSLAASLFTHPASRST